MADPDNQLDIGLFCPTCGKPTHTEKRARRKTESKAQEERLKIINVLAKLKAEETTSQGFIVKKTRLSSQNVHDQLKRLKAWKMVEKIGAKKGVRYRLNV